ncbi:MAG: tetratricopeptide repeat protein [Phycisphaerae bacterium]|nr:tetratricopeptide repeat protein [Phycisphaerae bacterium]
MKTLSKKFEPSSPSKSTHVQRQYTPQEVCGALGIEENTLERWIRLGLVRPQNGRYDFHDLIAMQTIQRLMQSGVAVETVAASVRKLARVLPDVERPLSKYVFIAESKERILVDIGHAKLTPDGQFVFDLDRAAGCVATIRLSEQISRTSDEWFHCGQAAEDEEQFVQALHAYRQAVRLCPQFAEAHFHIANVLCGMGRIQAAEERYRAAVEHDPDMAEAWYNLAHVQEQQGDLAAAVQSLEEAVSVAPEYADAHFNLALLLERSGRKIEAVAHWKLYLRLDSASDWAKLARSYLAG